MVKNDFQIPSVCPVCGEGVPAGAKACPGCGADERTGWNEDDTRYDGLDLPDEAFDDGRVGRPRNDRNPIWIGVAVVLLAALVLLFVFG